MQTNPSSALNWETIVAIGMLVGFSFTFFLKFIFPSLRDGGSKNGQMDIVKLEGITNNGRSLARIEERLEMLTNAIAEIHVTVFNMHVVVEELKKKSLDE